MNPLQYVQGVIEAHVSEVGGGHPLTLAELLKIVEEARAHVDDRLWEDYMGEDL